MKKLLITFLLAAVSVYGYETIPYMFNDLVPYGASPDEVNQILVDANFASVEAEIFRLIQTQIWFGIILKC